eukprot:TRINITY_DN11156_c0_g1_i1.p1 TRINITY_DN11156_c0_g1~~TRINITY_DN11156_c0_g1_i1.p1  ORF type:complete len:201 (-),score=27.30 TRINITY_DN11156_c0_g1_i1:58-660(-)
MIMPESFLTSLPPTLPSGEPYIFLSARQRIICERNPLLSEFAEHLPGWVPHRRIADALGFSHKGIDLALRRCGGQPYVWCTEFENVHTFWKYSENAFEEDGRRYEGSEHYYHKQKPFPYDDEVWLTRRDDVMRKALRHKFLHPEAGDLREILLQTHGHPLLSIKGDKYWGVTSAGIGENKLALMLEDLRSELIIGDLEMP